jgi:hypothetical protein
VEAAPKAPGAPALCDRIESTTLKDECHFQLAERRNDLLACKEAGAFVDDCRLHAWTAELKSAWGDPPDFPTGAASARAVMVKDGIDPADPRFWSATFRYALLRKRPFDRNQCKPLDPELRDACQHTGLATYADLLNHERDFGHFPCHGEPLPPTVAYTPDPDLEAMVISRLDRDLCKGVAHAAWPGTEVNPPESPNP